MKFRTARQRLEDRLNDPKNNKWTKWFAWYPVTITDCERINGRMKYSSDVYWLCFVERKVYSIVDWEFRWQYQSINKEQTNA